MIHVNEIKMLLSRIINKDFFFFFFFKWKCVSKVVQMIEQSITVCEKFITAQSTRD